MSFHRPAVALFVLWLAACGRTALPTDARGGEGDGDTATGTDSDTPGGELVGALFGQTSSTVNSGLEHGMEAPSGIASCGGKLFVVDSFQSRVLIWNSLPARGQADAVLGQPDFSTRLSNYSGVNARGISFADGIACDADHLALADAGNHRVLIWTPLPSASHTPATAVVGQPTFATNGSGLSATALNNPSGVAIANGRLFIADTNNHRVLGYDGIPTMNGMAAAFVLGQSGFTAGASNRGGVVGEGTMSIPIAVGSDGQRLVVVDNLNNRALVWSTVPTTSVNPSFVLGQPSFGTNNIPATPTAATLNRPHGLGFASGGRIAIGDTDNNRVMVFGPVTQSGQAAQHTFGSSAGAGAAYPTYSATTMSDPRSLVVANDEVYLSDALAHRVLVFDSPALTAGNPSSAKAVLGQPNLASGAKRCPENGVDASSLALPTHSVIHDGQAMVVDFLYHRVLFWNALPTTAGTPASFIIGQSDASTTEPIAGLVDDSHFRFPIHAAVIAGDFYVVDRDQHRIMIWDGVPTSPRGADRVLGQPNLAVATARVTTDGTSFLQPTHVASDGTRLLVTDASHNRVLMWNALPAGPSVPPDIVFGQPNKAEVEAHLPLSTTLNSPRAAVFTESGLVIADTAQHRVLIFNTVPTTDGAPADVVLGQLDMEHSDVLPTTASSTYAPSAVQYSSGLLFVSTMQRVLVWRGIPTTNNASADIVIGQPSFTTNLANDGGITADTLQNPANVTVDGEWIYIADVENNRIVRRRLP